MFFSCAADPTRLTEIPTVNRRTNTTNKINHFQINLDQSVIEITFVEIYAETSHFVFVTTGNAVK